MTPNDLSRRTTLESVKFHAAMMTVFRDQYSPVVVGSGREIRRIQGLFGLATLSGTQVMVGHCEFPWKWTKPP